MTYKKITTMLAAAMLAVGVSFLAKADDYPSRNITMIVPYPAGGPSDVVARIIADGMSKHLGQTIIIENVGGAGGTVGTTRAAGAPADGYTLLGASMGSHVAAPALFSGLKYDSTKDFEPIGLVSNAPAAVVARKDFPAKTLKEFITYIKANGIKVNQAHGGIGSSSHMACLLFNAEAGLSPNSVAYKGTGPALNDLVGSHVDYFCEQVVSVAPSVRGGTIKAYVVSGNERSAALPDIPSAKEAALPGYQISIWSAVFAPKGTPQPIVDKLSDALSKALDDANVIKRLGELGGTVPQKAERGPAHLAKVLKADIARWHPILTKAMAESKQGK